MRVRVAVAVASEASPSGQQRPAVPRARGRGASCEACGWPAGSHGGFVGAGLLVPQNSSLGGLWRGRGGVRTDLFRMCSYESQAQPGGPLPASDGLRRAPPGAGAGARPRGQ